MRRIDWKVFVLIGIILSVAVGFLYGTGILGGTSGGPGSSGDPLITQGFAEEALNQRIAELDARVNSLESTISRLEMEIAFLTGTPIDPGPGSPGPGTPTSPGTSTPPAGGANQANVGKTANVTGDVVNLRESASTSSSILRRLTPSDTFTITKVDRDWYQVQLGDGTIGWVAGHLVRVN